MNAETRSLLLRFAVAVGALFALTRWEWFVTRVREPYCELLASSIATAFDLVGVEVRHQGSTVFRNGAGGITVIPECDGIVLLSLFLSGVVAFPRVASKRPYLLALGSLGVLVGINWLRLVAMTLVGFYRPDLFDAMHYYVMQGLLILVTLGLYVAWLGSVEAADSAGR